MLVACALGSAGCSKLSDQECLVLRGEAFEIINVQGEGRLPHTCAEDADCVGTEWPGCAKPVNKSNLAKVEEIKGKFDKGECVEEAQTCPDAPDVYCKQGLCTQRFAAGGGI
jgi:hypothetical protein